MNSRKVVLGVMLFILFGTIIYWVRRTSDEGSITKMDTDTIQQFGDQLNRKNNKLRLQLLKNDLSNQQATFYWYKLTNKNLNYQLEINGKKVVAQSSFATASLKIGQAKMEQNQHLVIQSAIAKDLMPDKEYAAQLIAKNQTGKVVYKSNTINFSPKHSRIINVFNYTTSGSQYKDMTNAVQHAINIAKSGDVVEIPAGKICFVGPIKLKSGLTLLVNGTLKARISAKEFISGKKKSLALINSSAKQRLKNVSIIGTGIIDGSGWRTDFQGNYLKATASNYSKMGLLAGNEIQLIEKRFNLSNKKAYNLRSNLINIQHADNFYLGSGLTLRNSADHLLVITNSTNVVINNADFESYNANNGDGLDFVQSQGLRVMNSVFNTGDDSIDFSGGFPKDKRQGTTGNAVIINNYFKHGHGAVALGSGTTNGISNILVSDNVFQNSGVGLKIKSNPKIGGEVENITFRDSWLNDINGEGGNAAAIMLNYPYLQNGSQRKLTIKNVTISNITCTTTNGPLFEIKNQKPAVIKNILIKDIASQKSPKSKISGLTDSLIINEKF